MGQALAKASGFMGDSQGNWPGQRMLHQKGKAKKGKKAKVYKNGKIGIR